MISEKDIDVIGLMKHDTMVVMPRRKGGMLSHEEIERLSESFEDISELCEVNVVVVDRNVFKLTQEAIDAMQRALDAGEDGFDMGDYLENNKQDSLLQE